MITKEMVEAALNAWSQPNDRRELREIMTDALTAAFAAMPGPAVLVKALEDMEEVRKAVFGDVGDEPDVYADYDRCSELSGKMRQAIEELRHPIKPAPDLASENERLRAALEKLVETAVKAGDSALVSAIRPVYRNGEFSHDELHSPDEVRNRVSKAIRAALEDRT